MGHGSIPTGPSELYLALLKGKITPEDYAKKAKQRVHRESRERPAETGAQPQRA